MPANECKKKDRSRKLSDMITLQCIYLDKIKKLTLNIKN